MNPAKSIPYILIFLCSVSQVYSHALAKIRERKEDGDLKMEPVEAIVFAGANVTFTCSYPENVTFLWDFTSKIRSYTVTHSASLSNRTMKPVYFSRITIFGTSRYMSGEIACSVDDSNSKAVGFLIVNGVQLDGICHNSSDCITDRAVCYDGVCQCPRNYVHLRLSENGYDVCREMIYSLYDPCDLNEQCSFLVDPKSECRSVCVCAPYARDRKGRCVSLSDISYNRSQEMYRVGLIAVTCIIILIVAMSLWVTLKRSCHDRSNNGLHGATQTDGSYPQDATVEAIPDKPPAYDDVMVSEDVITAPPNIKDALKHCMTAKRLLRQVSAPAGQLLPQQGLYIKLAYDNKILPESKEE